MRKGERLIFFLVCSSIISGAAVAIVLYRWSVGSRLSESSGAWSDFGGFFGGIFGPLISFMTLVAILFTLSLQRRFLRRQSKEFSSLHSLQAKTIALQQAQANEVSQSLILSRLSAKKSDFTRSIERLDENLVRNIKQLEEAKIRTLSSMDSCGSREEIQIVKDQVLALMNRISELENRKMDLDQLLIEFTLKDHESLEDLHRHFHDRVAAIYSEKN